MTSAFTDYIAPLLPWLERSDVTDLMLNEPPQVVGPGPVWADVAGQGLVRTDLTMGAAQAELLIRNVAKVKRAVLDPDHPIVSVMQVFPNGTRWRFEACLPPASTAPTITIRKYTRRDVRLLDYAARCELTASQVHWLTMALDMGKVIVVAGATASGKTTLTDALLHAAGFQTSKRIFTIEREPELTRPNEVSTQRQVTEGTPFDTRAAVQSALRHRPDMIVVGELLSGSAAVECMKAWRTGHGGMTTLHAASATEALWRLYDLCIEGSVGRVEERAIARSVDVVVHVKKVGGKRVFTVCAEPRWCQETGEFQMKEIA
jgi:Flp pilus assembly CpaF family ATPase